MRTVTVEEAEALPEEEGVETAVTETQMADVLMTKACLICLERSIRQQRIMTCLGQFKTRRLFTNFLIYSG